ncbi:hypothetical protein EON81_05170 [bacterium]|nr:MAG: hypothetical protein EON81_05170 [bacterium]
MNCKEARLAIAGLNGDTLPEGLDRHIQSCSDCADLLAADAEFRSTLRRHVPTASPYMLGRIRQEIAAPAPVQLSWFEDLFGNKLMKIALPATALIAVALAILPRTATAAGPKETFDKMKKAILANAKEMSPEEAKKVPGKNHWGVVNGELTEVGTENWVSYVWNGKAYAVAYDRSTPVKGKGRSIDGTSKGGTIHVTEVGDSARVVTKDKKSGESKVIYVRGSKGTAKLPEGFAKIRLSLDETKYRSIAYGANQDQLVLTPEKKEHRYVVMLDTASRLPKNIRLERSKKGNWVNLRASNVKLN